MNYMGIDIGDGESCVCLLPSVSQIEPRPVTVTGRKSFLSAVAKNKQGQAIIGMDAVSGQVEQGLSVRFKSRFLSGKDGAREDMRLFLSGIYQTLRDAGALRDVGRIVVGCPAGWNEKARKQYKEMIQAVGFDSVHLVSESRAAFLYAKYAKSIQMDPTLIEESALVIDIGSSTLDFAYIVQGRETNVGTFGDVYLGAGAIDEALLDAAVRQSPERAAIEKTFAAAPQWRAYCLLAARRLKEEYFTRQAKGEKNISCRETLTLLYDAPLTLRLLVTDVLMWSVINLKIQALNGMSFYDMLEKALRHAYEQTREHLPQLVLLTGGASRMQFFQQLCRDRFPDAHFVLCEEPEFSIAKGLAYSARVDEGLHAFNRAIEKYLHGQEIHKAVTGRMAELINESSACMADIGVEEAKRHFSAWREGQYNTIRDMNAALSKAVAARINRREATDALESVLQNEINEICAALQPQIDELCKQYGVACSQMQLAGLKEMPGSSGAGLELHGDTAFLTTSMQVLITGVVATVLLLIPGGGVVDLIMIAGTAVAACFGRNLLDNALATMQIPLFLRKRLSVDKIFNARFYQQLRDSFKDRLTSDGAFQTQVSGNIEACLTDYVSRMAQKTEIAITYGDEKP